MLNCHTPEPIMSDFTVIVRQNVMLCLNRPPRNLRMSVLKFARNAARCLTDDLDLPLNRTSQQQIAEVVFKSTSLHEGDYRPRGRQHVPKIREIISVR